MPINLIIQKDGKKWEDYKNIRDIEWISEELPNTYDQIWIQPWLYFNFYHWKSNTIFLSAKGPRMTDESHSLLIFWYPSSRGPNFIYHSRNRYIFSICWYKWDHTIHRHNQLFLLNNKILMAIPSKCKRSFLFSGFTIFQRLCTY